MANSSDDSANIAPAAAAQEPTQAGVLLNAQIDALMERAERLLLRHEEITRTNTLLLEQLQAVEHERDLLKSRLAAARSRIDALIERLPEQPTLDTAAS